jgi:cysteine synthase A
VALSIIKAAEEEGLLAPYSGDKIYEGTVGSTGMIFKVRVPVA